MDKAETLHHKEIVAAATGGVRLEPNQYRCVLASVVMDNINMFQNKKMVAAENVGFRFEADLFKSVQIILGFASHGQH